LWSFLRQLRVFRGVKIDVCAAWGGEIAAAGKA
jgi:hypothetical protein